MGNLRFGLKGGREAKTDFVVLRKVIFYKVVFGNYGGLFGFAIGRILVIVYDRLWVI